MKILIADHHPVWLVGVRTVLGADEGFEVVGEVTRGPQVLPRIDQLAPDVLLLDIYMPGIHALTTIERIRERHPDVHVVACSSDADPETITTAFKHGACGYIVKSVDARDLASAIRQATDGTAFHALGLPSLDDSVARSKGITGRELEILGLVSAGLSNKAVARKLWVTEQTVKFHLTNIYRKIGAANRTEAARWAVEQGIRGNVPALHPVA